MSEDDIKKKKESRFCFVISPIGTDGSEERTNADWVLKGIIRPILESAPFSYRVTRADEGGPGPISNQIIIAIHEADLIIADLTDQNANVFYELAIAHTIGKKVIPMMTVGQVLPFDNYDGRTIFYDRTTIDGIEEAQSHLAEQVRRTESSDFKIDNPVITARGVHRLTESGDPSDQIMANLSDEVAALRRDLTALSMQRSTRSLMDYALASKPTEAERNFQLKLLDEYMEGVKKFEYDDSLGEDEKRKEITRRRKAMIEKIRDNKK